MNHPIISVCMATHNGELYVQEQLGHILAQLGPDDEVVIVDDASTDGTVQMVRAVSDPRLTLTINEANIGYVRTFERALTLSRGALVFLADQDDTWPPGRLDLMREVLKEASLVIGNVVLPDGSVFQPQGTGKRYALIDETSPPRLRTMVGLALSQVPYHGCAMGMRRELLDAALPFPRPVIELHDAWIGLVGLVNGSVTHVASPVVERRVHDNNASGRLRHPWAIARGRICFLGMVVAAWYRRRRSV